MDEILLSICCATYGHEKYIRQALDSILMQKVNFRYEVIVGEDCSPDGSRAILKEYEAAHPELFVMMYHDKNLGAMENCRRMYQRARGKYFICLELDDYWTDENKLQKQVDYLETHPEVLSVSHRCVVVDAGGNPLPLRYPHCMHKDYTLKDFVHGFLPGHTATNMYRNHYRDRIIDDSFIRTAVPKLPGDRRRAATMALYGRTVCLPDTMSAYRYQSTQTSYSSKVQFDFRQNVENNRLLCEFASGFGPKARREMNKPYFSSLLKLYSVERTPESRALLKQGLALIDNIPACVLFTVGKKLRALVWKIKKIRYV